MAKQTISMKKLRCAIESARSFSRETWTDVGIDSHVWIIVGTCGLSLHKMVRKREMRKFVTRWREKTTDDIIHELQDQEWEAT